MIASRWLNGSSIRSNPDSTDRARAIPTRCCMPPLSCPGYCAPSDSRPTSFRYSFARALALRAVAVILNVEAVVEHRPPREQPGVLEHVAHPTSFEASPTSSRFPEVGSSTRETRFRNVLLPHPDGPTSETKVWPSISKLTSVIAVTGSWPATRGGKTFLTFLATNLAIGFLPAGCVLPGQQLH